MKFQDKIVRLRKAKGWSQEDLAGQMNVSRQAISRWEGGTALPDAMNLVELSKLFGVTTDYLLNEAYASDYEFAHDSIRA
ncbi:MAG: helix-turn-helix transcriptional regulator [Eubacteriales bacterium]|nr:helix-turn-helix transcriptional regulator [Eubacteriales bacterium]